MSPIDQLPKLLDFCLKAETAQRLLYFYLNVQLFPSRYHLQPIRWLKLVGIDNVDLVGLQMLQRNRFLVSFLFFKLAIDNYAPKR